MEVDLTDEQWDQIKGCFPGREQKRTSPKGGRPWRDPRDVVNGVLWVLRTGAPWADLPRRYPPPSTCHRRFQQWVRSGVMAGVLEALALDLRDRGKLALQEAFIDGSFAPAKKGASKSERPSVVRGRRSWQLQTALVFLSPYPQRVLRLMKSRWSATRSGKSSSATPRKD